MPQTPKIVFGWWSPTAHRAYTGISSKLPREAFVDETHTGRDIVDQWQLRLPDPVLRVPVK